MVESKNNIPRRKKICLDQSLYLGGYIYFITICTYNKKQYFGRVKNGEMQLNKIGKIISSFKRHCFKEVKELINIGDIRSPLREELNTNKTIWQKSFYDRIIRNKKEYDILWQYIDKNPIQWELDSLNPDHS